MSKILDALNEYSARVSAANAPDDEKRPVVLNLAAESNYGKYKFIPIMPASAENAVPFVTAHFNEIKLHIKGAKYDSWRRIISSKDLDISTVPSNEAELLKTVYQIIKDLDKMEEPEFYKATRGHVKDKSRSTLRYKTYVLWYAYILEAKDSKGNTISDHDKKFRLMVMPSAKMEAAVNACFKTIMDNYDSPLRENAIESLFGGGIENRKDYFELSVERPKNYEITLNPMLYQPGMKVSIPEKLISDAGYANLSHPLVVFTGGKDVSRPYNLSTIELIKKTILERLDPPKDGAVDDGDAEEEGVKDPEFKVPESAGNVPF